MKRPTIALLIVATTALGGASRIWPIGVELWDKSFGDVAYAIMIAWLVLFVRPSTKPLALGAVAIVICFAIETFQLTGIPARAPRVVQLVLGRQFAWHDMACYVIGGCLAALILRASSAVRPST